MSGMLHHPVVAISRFMAFVVMVAGCQLLGIGDAQADYCADTFGTVLVNPDDPQGDCRVLEAITLNYSGTYTDIVLMQHVDRGRDSHEAPERFVEVVSALRDTAARAGSVLTSDLPALRLPRVIHVILVPQEHSGGGRMRTLPQTYLSAGRIRDCPLVVYGYGEGLSPGRLRRTFAHELFHCAQYETYYDQTRDDGSKWWREGSAEWFEDRVFPEHVADSDLDVAIRLFEERARDQQPMHEAEYSNAVLFAWLAARGRVGDYLGAMAGSGTSQTAAMRRAMPAGDYRQFAQDYHEPGITFSSGRIARGEFSPHEPGITTGEPERDPDIERRPRKAFAIYREKIEFVPGEYRPDGKIGTDTKVFSDTPGSWGRLPARLVVACGEQKTYRVVTMPTEDAPPLLKVKPGTTKAVQCGECGATGGDVRRAGCVVGSWQMVTGAHCDMLGSLAGSFGATASVTACEPGTASVTFNPDGTFGGMLQNAHRSVSVALPGRRRAGLSMQLDSSISLVKSTGLWKAEEETGVLDLCSTSTVGAGQIRFSGGPEGAERSQAMRFDPVAYVPLQYACAGNSMTITVLPQGAGVGGFSVQLERIATPSP